MIDQLLNKHTVTQIAAILNERGIISGAGKPYHPQPVGRLVRRQSLKPRYDRLREAGLLTLIAKSEVPLLVSVLGVNAPDTVAPVPESERLMFVVSPPPVSATPIELVQPLIVFTPAQ